MEHTGSFQDTSVLWDHTLRTSSTEAASKYKYVIFGFSECAPCVLK